MATKKKQPEVSTISRAYAAGEVAYHDGLGIDDCPHVNRSIRKLSGFNACRADWMAGWTNARLNERFAPLFLAYGVGPLK